LVAARIVETGLIFVGAVSLLSLITLRDDVAGTAGADPASLVTTGQSHVAVYDWTFLLSQSLMPVIVDLLLGYLLFRSRLVPRIWPILAFIGAPMLLASDLALFFGVYEKGSLFDLVAVLPIAVFEFSFGVRLLVKGFDPASPLFSRASAEVGRAPIPVPRTGVDQPDGRVTGVG
jgi:hypothetical protein